HECLFDVGDGSEVATAAEVSGRISRAAGNGGQAGDGGTKRNIRVAVNPHLLNCLGNCLRCFFSLNRFQVIAHTTRGGQFTLVDGVVGEDDRHGQAVELLVYAVGIAASLGGHGDT